jgi:hypothetical protein
MIASFQKIGIKSLTRFCEIQVDVLPRELLKKLACGWVGDGQLGVA